MQPSFRVSKENMEKMFYGNNKVLQTCCGVSSPLSQSLAGACTGPHNQHLGMAHALIIKVSTDPSLTLPKKITFLARECPCS